MFITALGVPKHTRLCGVRVPKVLAVEITMTSRSDILRCQRWGRRSRVCLWCGLVFRSAFGLRSRRQCGILNRRGLTLAGKLLSVRIVRLFYLISNVDLHCSPREFEAEIWVFTRTFCTSPSVMINILFKHV